MEFFKASASIFPIFLFATWSCLYKIHTANESPYIDEEFHVPQAQRFCDGSTEWDPKITTPPGLYFVAFALLKILGISSSTFLCEIFLLRLTNSIFICLNFIVLCWIYSRIHQKCRWTGILEVLDLSLFPILYFFSFLYYTDVMSTFFILIMYLNFLYGQICLAAICGFISLWMRQTNVIWVAFTATLHGYNLLTDALDEEKLNLPEKGIIQQFMEGIKRPNIILNIILQELPFLLVGLSFVGFLLWNGSIVLGDKSAHQATIHLPQLFYFSLVCAAFSPAIFLKYIPKFVKNILCNKICILVGIVAIAAAVHFNSMAHPYLLADNRHYTFYLWKRLTSAKVLKYLLVPVYLFCLSCIINSLKGRGSFFQLLFAFCVFASLVPQMLLEPRYFVIPYVMFRLHVPQQDTLSNLANLFVAVAVNCATVYVYVFCPFAKETKVHFIW